MDIVLIKDKENEILDVFNTYNMCCKKIFETNGVEQEQLIIKYRELKTKIDKWAIAKVNSSDYIKFSEYEYQKGIKDIIALNLLSNGLYSMQNIEKLFVEYFDVIEEAIKEKIKAFYIEYTGNILIWNTEIEV